MWCPRRHKFGGLGQFFRTLIASHTDLGDFYETNFSLTYTYKYSLTEIENMLPWERDVFIGMIQRERAKNS
jgi:hypothetical protein